MPKALIWTGLHEYDPKSGDQDEWYKIFNFESVPRVGDEIGFGGDTHLVISVSYFITPSNSEPSYMPSIFIKIDGDELQKLIGSGWAKYPPLN